MPFHIKCPTCSELTEYKKENFEKFQREPKYWFGCSNLCSGVSIYLDENCKCTSYYFQSLFDETIYEFSGDIDFETTTLLFKNDLFGRNKINYKFIDLDFSLFKDTEEFSKKTIHKLLKMRNFK